MAERVEKTDEEREKYIRKVMEEKKRRYETVNDKLSNLETRLDTMSRDQAKSSYAIQFKLDSLLRDSITQEKRITDNT